MAFAILHGGFVVKILSYQGTPVLGDIRQNLESIRSTAIAAQQLDVDVIVFPELYVTGYNIGDKLIELAQPLDGQICSDLTDIALEFSVSIVCGFPETDGNQLFNSAVAIDKQGNLVGHHRKVFLFGEAEKKRFIAGNHFHIFELEGHKCGLSICYDIEFPEAIRDLAKQGAEIIFNPTANMQPYVEVPLTLARARALENGVVVIYANLCGEENGLEYTGLSAIIGPNGVDIARAGASPTMLISSISDELSKAKAHPVSTQIKDLINSSYYEAALAS